MHTDTKTTRLMSRRDAVTEARMEFDHLNLTEEELRAALDTAGVHRYVSTGDVFYMGRGYAAIHAVRPGMPILETSARTGQGIDAWLAWLETLAEM